MGRKPAVPGILPVASGEGSVSRGWGGPFPTLHRAGRSLRATPVTQGRWPHGESKTELQMLTSRPEPVAAGLPPCRGLPRPWSVCEAEEPEWPASPVPTRAERHSSAQAPGMMAGLQQGLSDQNRQGADGQNVQVSCTHAPRCWFGRQAGPGTCISFFFF